MSENRVYINGAWYTQTTSGTGAITITPSPTHSYPTDDPTFTALAKRASAVKRALRRKNRGLV